MFYVMCWPFITATFLSGTSSPGLDCSPSDSDASERDSQDQAVDRYSEIYHLLQLFHWQNTCTEHRSEERIDEDSEETLPGLFKLRSPPPAPQTQMLAKLHVNGDWSRNYAGVNAML